MASEIIFLTGFCVLSWTWAGYPAAIGLLAASKRRRSPGTRYAESGIISHVTIVVPVHNAEHALARKLENCLGMDYPRDRFDIVIVSDGSSDGSGALVRGFAARHANVSLLESAMRIGKSAAQNLAASAATGEILLLTDVEAVLPPNALRHINRAFRYTDVGCVAGRVVWGSAENQDRADSENLYWRFEHAIWTWEGVLGTLACASGTCMAVRRPLFGEIDPRYGDDVVLPLDVLDSGARVAYEPALTAVEFSTVGSAAVLRARARMTLRSLQGTMSRRAVFSPLHRPGLFVTVASHKLLRWATPFVFLAVLGSATVLTLNGEAIPGVVLVAQCAWLAAAAVGYLAQRCHVRVPLAAAAYELAIENVGMFIGVTRAVIGHTQIAYRPGGR